MEEYMIIIWILIIIIGVGLDILSSAMIFVWFALGAFVAVIANLCGATISLQIILAIFVSLIGIAVGYPFARKIIKKSVKPKKTMEENYIGQEYIAEENILDHGQLKVSGIYWTVINKGEEIKKGEKLRVTGIEGTKLIVTLVKNNLKIKEEV